MVVLRGLTVEVEIIFIRFFLCVVFGVSLS